MKARYYGYCPAVPDAKLAVTRWYDSPEGHIVLLEFVDDNGVRWLGPEFPRDLVGARVMEVHEGKCELRVIATRIDAIQGWTEFDVERRL